MKLTRLRVSELRRFRAPFELAEMQHGLNIFAAANEAGKSTLVRAIRAAFFERHKSSSVDDLRPYDDSAAAPEVELDFEIAGTPHRLSKRFLKKMRCDLVIGTRRLEGVEAEDFLAEKLGFQFSLKGASREEFWGVPGLLWMEQGTAQSVRSSVVHATNYLRTALDDSLGEVAASGGDEVVAQVRKWRDELLTGTGKPKASFLTAIDESSALEARVAELQDAVATYQSQVDQLKLLRDAHAIDVAQRPWEALRVQQAAAQQALQEANVLASELDRAQEKLLQAGGMRDLLSQRLAAAEQQAQSLAAREAFLAAAASSHERAAGLEADAVLAEAAATARLHSARDALAIARQEDNRRVLAQQAVDARERSVELASLLERATAESERAIELKADAARHFIEASDLAALKQQQAQLKELQISQAAVATRVQFELDPGVTVDFAGDSISGHVEHLLTAPTVITLPGVGRLRIAPGGRDLAELAQAQTELQDKHHALLQRLGLTDLADAEARATARAQFMSNAAAAEKSFKLLAPKGLDQLRTDLSAIQAREEEATRALARLPAETGATTVALNEAEQQHDKDRIAADSATQQLQMFRQSLAAAASQHAGAKQERDALKAVLDDPQLLAELTEKRRELVEAKASESTMKAAVAGFVERIAASRPDILKQDVERFRRSADEIENQHRLRDRQIVQLETALAAAGAQGLEEDLERARSETTLAQRRSKELRRRAEALDLLLRKLEQRRHALTRRLQAPLQRHLDRYLQLLFPAGRLDVDEHLIPGVLTRPGTRGQEAGDFETLSFGAREQMGVISRLAYADLLKEAGRPTLIILDDALVHSDEKRLAQMKRVLFDAAQRHQVLLFTCHAASWRDMGVVLRSLDATS